MKPGMLAGLLAGWIGLCSSTLALDSRAQGKPPGNRPNVIVVLTDDQGWWDMGVYGNPHIETPIMDRLAREAVRFTHFYVSPLCATTRAALLTGRHYQRTGTVDTYMGLETMGAEETILGQVFQRVGYRTALIGKWHLGRYFKYHPLRRGFDEFFGLPLALVTRYFDPDQLYQGTQPVTTTGYITDVLTDQAIRFVRRCAQRPFFLYLSYNAAHSPYLVPDSYIERYLAKGLPLREARIYGMITSIDDNLSQLLEVVDDLGLRQDTIFIFMSDNGGMSRYFRAGLRGEKAFVYEGGVRVPFIARWPGQFPAGAVVDAPAQDIDLFPTLCALTGVPPPEGVALDGKNIETLLRKGKGESPHAYLFHQWNHIRPVMDLPPKPIPLPSPPSYGPDPVRLGAVPYWAVQEVRTGYKLVRWTYKEGENLVPRDALYNLRQDPGEGRDLASRYPEVVERLRGRFAAWFADVTRGRDYARVPIEVGHDEEDPIEIELLQGERSGAGALLQFDRFYRDRIEQWTGPDTALRWRLDVVRQGPYEIILEYGCDPADAGSAAQVRIGAAQLRHTVQATPGEHVFRPVRVGTLTLARGPAVLEIRPLTLTGRSLMTLHKIWLKRVDGN